MLAKHCVSVNAPPSTMASPQSLLFESKKVYYTIPEAAALLSMKSNTVYKLVQAGKIPARHFGSRLVRIHRDFIFRQSPADIAKRLEESGRE